MCPDNKSQTRRLDPQLNILTISNDLSPKNLNNLSVDKINKINIVISSLIEKTIEDNNIDIQDDFIKLVTNMIHISKHPPIKYRNNSI